MKGSSLRRKFFVFALALALSGVPLLAPTEGMAAAPQGRRSTAQQAGPTRPAAGQGQGTTAPKAPTPLAQPAPIASRTLANGLEVIVLEDHAVPLVTVELAVRNGSFTEPPEFNGLSHLYEHMFFKPPREMVLREPYFRNIDQLGIVYNGETREEIVNYYFTTTTPNFPVAMRFMRDMARFQTFDEQQFEQEREVVIGELDRHESNPYGVLGEEMNRRLFYKHPSRKRPGGNRETVRAATTDMMRTIKDRYYVPNNSAIIVTGDVNPADVFRLTQELFGEWPRGEDPFKKFPLVEHPPLEKSEGAVITSPVQNVVIQLGWHGPSVGKDDAATYAADVFSFILRQPNSRFQRALVDTELTTGAGIGYYTQRNVGPIQVLAQTTPDKAKAVLRAIYQEIERFDDADYYTDEELESAKALLEADDLYSREKLSEYAHTIGFWWSSTGLDYYRSYLPRLRATSRADISRYVRTYIQGKPHVALALMSAESAKGANLTPEDLIGKETVKANAVGK